MSRKLREIVMLLDLPELIKKYNIQIKNIYHIGAHYGEEYDIFKTCGANKIMMFEPLKQNFDILLEKFSQYDDVILINSALGHRNDKVIMNVETNNNMQSSSILNPKIHLLQHPNIIFDKKQEVVQDILDNFSENEYNFISIDVQGYELRVFEGGTNTLNHIDAILSEVNNDEVYENCAKVEQLDKFLSFYGFKRVETN